MAAEIHRVGQARDVRRQQFDVHRERRDTSAEALRPDAQCVDAIEDRRFEFSEIGKSAAISVTRASASVSRARIARRVGSHSALKTSFNRADLYSSIWVNIGDGDRIVKLL